jgi:hypothetical protein
MKPRVYHGDKPESRYQSVETLDEAAVAIRSELGHMQWQLSKEKRVAASMQSDSGHFEYVLQ